MSLLQLWKNTPEQIETKTIQQLISFAGSGHLGDGNAASEELREFLSNVSSDYLSRYAEECLTSRFEGGGFALQDVVNEVGSRLGCEVTPGRYRGVQGQIGFDGLWLTAEGNSIIVEVKVTDAFSIDLETIAEYRRALIREHKIAEDTSSILIVIGREDTGNLEAQIRGSKHAWDIRLISVDALIRLLNIREQVEDPDIEKRIRSILIPREFTRLDEIIDLAFSATEDLLEETPPAEEEESAKDKKFIPVNFNEACVARISKAISIPLLKRSRAIFTTPDNNLVIMCAVSREYDSESTPGYWFAFHDHQKEKLESAPEAFVAYGCGSPEKLLLIPRQDFLPWVEGMNITTRENGKMYWHVQIFDEQGKLVLRRKKGQSTPDLTRYLVK